MVVVIGNNVAALFISAYLEKEKLAYRRYYTKELMDYTFYFNDSFDGMQKKAMEKLSYHNTKNENQFFKIRTDKQEYCIKWNISDLFNHMKELSQSEIENLNQVETVITGIGGEWKEIIDHDFLMKVNRNSYMTKNFMKSYESFIKEGLADEEMQKICMSLVPRTDISLNTAAGYISNQVFDRCSRENKLEDFVAYMKNFLKEENQIKVNSFDEIEINKEEKEVKTSLETISYDSTIITTSNVDGNTRLATYYVTNEKKDDTYVFLYPEGMKEASISQMILWNGKENCQLDVYFSNETDEEQIEQFINESLPYLKISKVIPYESLKEQYGSGDFAGWAFNCKESMKNPMSCKNIDYIDIARWGNAHFTSALLAINCLEKGKY